MATMDIFGQNAFKMVSLTEAIRRAQTIPGLIGSLGLFTPRPVRTRTVAIETVNKSLKIIQTSDPGSPRNNRDADKRQMIDLRVRRIEESSTITAEEIQDIRQFGSEDMMKSVQTEVAERQQDIIDDMSATVERLRLSCINGILLDADDSVIYDYNSTFGITAATEIAFDWANKTKVKQFIAANVIRPMVRAIGNAPTGMRIIALCGDDFFDELQENGEYKDRYKNNNEASELLDSHVFQAIDAWGVTWINYRGTDDNSKVAIASDKVKFIPMGVRGLFVEAFAPAPTMPLVNSRGQEWYSRIITDKDREEWAKVEVESHRLPICTRPEGLLSGRAGS